MSAAKIRPTLDAERSLAQQGADYIVGFDEVGRGALAGPVMVGAALLDASAVNDLSVPEGLADSKMLSAGVREGMLEGLKTWPLAWAVGAASNQEIDEWGIMHALGLAALRALATIEDELKMEERLAKGGSRPRLCAILDGSYDYISKALPTLDAPAVSLAPEVGTQVKADASCASVACASVIAKVTRDQLMVELAQSKSEYEPYDWAHNKGYGSATHQAAIVAHGPSDYHRISWHLI
ncbi:ribonuclease [Bombiscardovia apis]|uniref:Ribonuclease n=1 Tax=Bombiscardovia apis TaxID=2932182 RepID=A0ABN6SG58_9BIFI|nr:ribonuclease HII [Bombiscardovia apis]BDR54228.1 ribonuclease [Bombiscardovia apis]